MFSKRNYLQVVVQTLGGNLFGGKKSALIGGGRGIWVSQYEKKQTSGLPQLWRENKVGGKPCSHMSSHTEYTEAEGGGGNASCGGRSMN